MAALSAFVLADFLGTPVWLWLAFLAIVLALLAFDLGVLHRDDREIGVAESLWLSAGYIAMGLAFGAWVWWYLGAAPGIDYFTGFLVEKSLSMDNVFVIAMIFTFFAVPREYQHRVLFWGIVGVIALRAVMIGLGAALVAQFSWILYVFGAFLLATGVKMLVFADSKPDLARKRLLRFMRSHMRVTDTHHGNRFFVRLPDPATGRAVRHATPLFLALVRMFIGTKIFLVNILGKFPPALSLAVAIGLIAGGALWSLWKTRGPSGGRPATAER